MNLLTQTTQQYFKKRLLLIFGLATLGVVTLLFLMSDSIDELKQEKTPNEIMRILTGEYVTNEVATLRAKSITRIEMDELTKDYDYYIGKYEGSLYLIKGMHNEINEMEEDFMTDVLSSTKEIVDIFAEHLDEPLLKGVAKLLPSKSRKGAPTLKNIAFEGTVANKRDRAVTASDRVVLEKLVTDPNFARLKVIPNKIILMKSVNQISPLLTLLMTILIVTFFGALYMLYFIVFPQRYKSNRELSFYEGFNYQEVGESLYDELNVPLPPLIDQGSFFKNYLIIRHLFGFKTIKLDEVLMISPIFNRLIFYSRERIIPVTMNRQDQQAILTRLLLRLPYIYIGNDPELILAHTYARNRLIELIRKRKEICLADNHTDSDLIKSVDPYILEDKTLYVYMDQNMIKKGQKKKKPSFFGECFGETIMFIGVILLFTIDFTLGIIGVVVYFVFYLVVVPIYYILSLVNNHSKSRKRPKRDRL